MSILKTNILHLSDLHFGIEPTRKITKYAISCRENVLDNLIKKIEELEPDWKPDILVITGDIGWKGKEEDYQKALTWINEKITGTLKIKKENIIVVPGNHDINLEVIKKRNLKIAKKQKEVNHNIKITKNPKEAEHIRETAKNLQNIRRNLEIAKNPDEVEKQLIGKGLIDHEIPFKDYKKFCYELNKNKLKVFIENSKIIGCVNIGKICFIILNSSWYFRNKGEDNEKLWLGSPHIDLVENYLKKENQKKNDRITISLFHHPPLYLKKSESIFDLDKESTIHHLSRVSDIILTGHTHGKLVKPNLFYSSTWHFSGGATYLNKDYKNNFSIYQINIKEKILSRRGYEYNYNDWNEIPVVAGDYLLKTKDGTRKIGEKEIQVEHETNKNKAKRILHLIKNENETAKKALQENIDIYVSKELKNILSDTPYYDKLPLSGKLIALYDQAKKNKVKNTVMLRQNACYYISLLNMEDGKIFLKRIIKERSEGNKFIQRAIYIGLTYFCNEIDYLNDYFDELEIDPQTSSINAGYHQCYYADKLFVEGYTYSDIESKYSVTANIRHLKNKNKKLSWPLDLYTLRYFLKRQSFDLLSKKQREFLDKWISSPIEEKNHY